MAKTTARKFQTQQVHYIRRVLNWNDADIAAAYVGTIPAGSCLIGSDATVTAAFNAVTSNNVAMGSLAVLTEVMTSAQVGAGSTGIKTTVAANASPFLVDLLLDQDVYASYTFTGSAPTAGRCVLMVRYIPTHP